MATIVPATRNGQWHRPGCGTPAELRSTMTHQPGSAGAWISPPHLGRPGLDPEGGHADHGVVRRAEIPNGIGDIAVLDRPRIGPTLAR